MRISDWSSDVCSSDLGFWPPLKFWGSARITSPRLLCPANRISSCVIITRGDDGCAPRIRVPVTVIFSRRSEEHTSELQSLMRISYAVFCLKKKITHPKRQLRRQLYLAKQESTIAIIHHIIKNIY